MFFNLRLSAALWASIQLSIVSVAQPAPSAASGTDTPDPPASRDAALAPAPQRSEVDLGQYFTGFDGCFVLFDAAANRRYEYRPERLDLRLSPCSTFKIPNSLIGLETGVLSGAEHEFKWDGVTRERAALNRDHTLRTAIRDSVVWYYQRVAAAVGPQRMQAFLDRFDYGNRDISAGLTEFWLGTSLLISANEQVRFLDLLRRDALPAAPANQQIVRDILVVERDAGSVVYAKSGSDGKDGKAILGWYVGWVTTDDQAYVFAMNIRAADGANGYLVARRITMSVLAAFERGDFGPLGLRLPKSDAGN